MPYMPECIEKAAASLPRRRGVVLGDEAARNAARHKT
jgi:hypothetical protein